MTLTVKLMVHIISSHKTDGSKGGCNHCDNILKFHSGLERGETFLVKVGLDYKPLSLSFPKEFSQS